MIGRASARGAGLRRVPLPAGVPAGPPRAAAALSWVAVCIVAAGALTYAYLALVARALPAAGYGAFGAYWSAALVVGFGAFSPVEWELARALQSGRGDRLPRGTGRTLLAVTALSAVVVGLAGPAFGASGAALVVPLLVLCPVSALQFAARGTMLGSSRLGAHGAVLLVDAALRVAGAALVATVVRAPGAGDFAWTLVAAIALAHTPVLLVLRPWRGRTSTVAAPAAATSSARPFVVATAHLLVGTLCAQVLLNGAPLLLTSVASTPAEQALAGRFIAAFTLVRLPLFVAVPLQSALVPVLTRLVASGDAAALRRLLLRLAGGVAVLSGAAVLLGLVAGPPLVGLLFGDRYRLGGGALALLALGSALHLGLIVAAQVLVASARHRQVAAVWVTGLATAALLFWLVPGLVTAASLAFTGGSGAALLAAGALLASAGRPGAGAVDPGEDRVETS